MQIRKISDTITTVGDTVRIEVGPVRRREVATEELLSNDVTAGHYQPGSLDALGKPIVLGEEFDFIDWKSSDRAWYVYKMDETGRWLRYGDGYPAEDQALSAAVDLVTV